MSLKTSFCTIAYRNNPEIPLTAILDTVANNGYNGAELWYPHIEKLSPTQLTDIKHHAAQLGLAIPILSPYLGNFNLEMTNRQEMIDRTLVAAPAAQALGSPLIRAFAGWTCECSSLTASDVYWQYNLDGFAEMARIADDHNLDIAIETHAATLADSVTGVLRIIDHAGPRIKINLQLDDIAPNSDLPNGTAVYEKLKPHIVHMHVPVIIDDPARHADHKTTLQAMATDNFTGYISSEYCKADKNPETITTQGIATIRDLTK